jgi:integrase
VTLGNFIARVKTLFTWVYEEELIPAPVRYGSSFDRPPRRLLRAARRERGQRMIPAPDLRRMIEEANPQLSAMILLGLNAGFGCLDVSRLNRSDLARERGWLSLTRTKTEVDRRTPLWPETIQALQTARAVRPEPKDPADRDAAFITREGHRFVRYTDRTGEGRATVRRDSVGDAFVKLANRCGVVVVGRFYTLRHVFRTVADELRDVPAIHRIMGHSSNEIDDHYRERIADDRLVAVARHVRSWLFKGRTK